MAENRELALVLKLVADQFQSEMKKSGGVVGEFQKFIGDWRTQLTLAGTALFAIAKSTANFGEEALKTSQRLGLTVEKTTALQYAAHLADVPVQTLETSLKKLSQNAVEAASGTGEGAKLFTSLGISATDASGKIKPLDVLLFEFQDRLGGVGNQAEFVDAGVKAFGKSFLELVPFIKQGSAATKEAQEEGKKLGATMTHEQAVAASKFNDELKRLDAQVNGVKLSIGNALIPTLQELIALFRTIGVGTGLGAGLQLIQHQLIMLNTLLKELQAGSQFLFGTGKDALSFDQLKQKFSQIEAGGRQQLFEMRHPGALNGETSTTGGPGGPPPVGSKSIIGTASEHDAQLAKALNEIWQTGNRALEIRDKLLGETMAKWDERAQLFAQFEQRERDANERRAEGEQALRAFAEAEFTRDDEMLAHAGAVQEARGRMIVEATQLEVRLRDQALAEQAAANRTFFDEWKLGMDKYVRDTKSGFGLGADLARRTAQTMEQGFRTFFFDVMDGKITSVKDAFSGLLQFVKQIIAQITAQLITQQVLKLAVSGIGAFSGGGGAIAGYDPRSGFASGGSFRVGGYGGTDSQRVAFRASPDETVTVETPSQRRQGGGSTTINISIQGGGVQESGSGASQNWAQLARDLGKLVEAKLVDEQRPGGLLARGAA